MRKYALALSSLLLFGGAVKAQEEQVFSVVSSVPIVLYGGASGGYFWTDTYQTKDNEEDQLQVSNALFGLTGKFGNQIKLGFDVAVGTVLVPHFFNAGQTDPVSYDFTANSVSNTGFGLIWGYATFEPYAGITAEAGVIPTKVGYELPATYANPNVLLGVVWTAQPVIYEGFRLNFDLNEMAGVPVAFYAEYNQEYNGDNWGVGFSFGLPDLGVIQDLTVAINYMDYANVDQAAWLNKNILDFVLNFSLPFLEAGLNFDYHWLDDRSKQQGRDDNAYGVALYVAPHFTLAQGKLTFPIRFEYFDEGTSGIFTGCEKDNSGWTFTFTPTYKPTPNTYLRLEYAYIDTDQHVLDGDNNRTVISAEIGFSF
ncbi:MAG: outer membrane beta-barrel protein [Aquificae bacterium]|nr:outer membrane beta-barrel protein [Aquificota bacterium]